MHTKSVRLNRHTRDIAKSAIDSAPDGWMLTIKPPKRSLEQNDLLWGLLTNVSNAIPWAGKLRSPEDWKTLFTAAYLEVENEVVPGLHGQKVALGRSTSRMTTRELAELTEYILCFCAENHIPTILDGTFSK